jgi:hypothetical protein
MTPQDPAAENVHRRFELGFVEVFCPVRFGIERARIVQAGPSVRQSLSPLDNLQKRSDIPLVVRLGEGA